jgi:hypothetical protein
LNFNLSSYIGLSGYINLVKRTLNSQFIAFVTTDASAHSSLFPADRSFDMPKFTTPWLKKHSPELQISPGLKVFDATSLQVHGHVLTGFLVYSGPRKRSRVATRCCNGVLLTPEGGFEAG